MSPALRALAALAFVASTLVVAGCKSTAGHEQAGSISTKIEALGTAVGSLQEQVSSAAESLASVVAKAEEDPVPAFKKFETDFEALESRLAKATSGLSDVQAQAKSYFEDWKKQAAAMTDEDLRKRSEERQAELSKAVEELSAAMQPAAVDLKAYTATLGDLRKYLSNDLTPAGIASIKDKSKAATKSAKSINKQLGEVLECAEEAAPIFAAAKPPATSTPPKK